MEFELDFSQINLLNDPDKITPAEIRSVFENPKSRFKEMEGYPKEYFYNTECGYSKKKRILLIVLYVSNDEDSKQIVAQVKVANEGEIRKYFL